MLAYGPVREAWDLLQTLAGHAALSGAGPGIFAWFSDSDTAASAAERLEGKARGRVLLARGMPPNADSTSIKGVARALRREAERVDGRDG